MHALRSSALLCVLLAACTDGGDKPGGDPHDTDTNAPCVPTAEVCDGADNDCDGAVDDTDGDVVPSGTWYRDGDGDGFGADAVRACLQPAGTASSDGDCDDTSATIHPDATEECGGEVDEDCDGEAAACTWEGTLGAETADAVISWDEPEGGRVYGTIVVVPDSDGDGGHELAIAGFGPDSRGKIVVFTGGPRGALGTTDANATLTGSDGTAELGARMTAGDFDDDGLGDLASLESVTTAYPYGSAVVLPGPFVDGSSADAPRVSTNYGYGYTSIAASGDQDGDGGQELALGVPAFGSVLVYTDAATRDHTLLEHTSWAGFSTSSAVPQTVLDVGDLQGDGGSDLMVGDLGAIGDDTRRGRVWLVDGPLPAGEQQLDTARDTIYISGAADEAGIVFARGQGDINGDGYGDVFVAGTYVTELYGFFGPIDRRLSTADADVVVIGPSAYASIAGDFDADGESDLIGSGSDGVVYAWAGGTLAGTVDASDAVVGFDPPEGATADWGDLDGDGRSDALLTCPGAGSGAVLVWYAP